MMLWSENLLQCIFGYFFGTFLSTFKSTLFELWVQRNLTLKESGWCLDQRICCKPYTASPPGPEPTLTLALRPLLLCQFILFFAFFHASTFHIFRLNFSHFLSDFSILLLPAPFFAVGFLYVPSLAGLQYLCSKLWEGKISLFEFSSSPQTRSSCIPPPFPPFNLLTAVSHYPPSQEIFQ